MMYSTAIEIAINLAFSVLHPSAFLLLGML